MMSNNARTLYVGSARELIRRVHEHKHRLFPNAFTARYTFDRLVWFEMLSTKEEARGRELQLKGWKRERKVELIVQHNPTWKDLSQQWPDALCGK